MSKKVIVYTARPYDEKKWIEKYAAELDLEVLQVAADPTVESAAFVPEGCTCASVITTAVGADVVQALYDKGIRHITTRSIGYDHIDMKKAAELGVTVGHATYDTECVAEYAVMLMLMSLRRVKTILNRAAVQDFTLRGKIGQDINTLTVGIIGTGHIGTRVAEILKGFGCKVLGYDLYPNKKAEEFLTYTTQEEIFAQSDIITLHTPLFDSNRHTINEAAIASMKDGVIIINTARGGLIDSEALIKGLETGKIGAAGLDVVEREQGLYYNDLRFDIMDNRQLAILKSFPNVVVTPHMAFYTEATVGSMIWSNLRSCLHFMEGTEDPWLVK